MNEDRRFKVLKPFPIIEGAEEMFVVDAIISGHDRSNEAIQSHLDAGDMVEVDVEGNPLPASEAEAV